MGFLAGVSIGMLTILALVGIGIYVYMGGVNTKEENKHLWIDEEEDWRRDNE